MPIVVTCGDCGKRVRVADEHAGKKGRCPGCKSPISIRAASNAEEVEVEVEVVEEKIRHTCGSCGAQLRVSVRARGKRMKCPKCQQVTDVPAAEVADESSPPSAAAPAPSPESAAPVAAASWHLRSHDGEEYGPFGKDELDEWVEEGRVTATCQVSSDHETWQDACNVYPELLDDGDEGADEDEQGDEEESFFPEGYEPVLHLKSEGSSLASKAIVSGLKKSPRGNELLSAQYFQIGESRSLWERIKAGSVVGPFAQEKEIDVDRVHVITISDPAGEIHVVAPTDNGAPCPTEFISVLPGRMPTSLALLRGEGGHRGIEASNSVAGSLLPEVVRAGMSKLGSQAESYWDVLDDDEPSTAADFANQFDDLRADLRFDGKFSGGPIEITYNLDWIAQVLPLSDEAYLLVAQYIPQSKMFGMDFGAAWFVDWRARFLEMAEQMPTEGEGCFCALDHGNWGLVAYEVLELDVFE